MTITSPEQLSGTQSEKVFGAITALFQSVPESVAAANRLGKAYADGIGKPEWYRPYNESDPEAVAMDLAGLYAADTAANCIAMMRDGKVDSAGYVRALIDIAVHGKAPGSPSLSPAEVYIAKNIANATWRAGQPFRGIVSGKPLGRLGGQANVQFNCLPDHQRDKDLVQVVVGAEIILRKIAFL